MADIELVTAALRLRFPEPPKAVVFGRETPALNVIDCVLSLNRRYEGFVVPRVERFAVRNPKIGDLASLRGLILSYDTPLDFLKHHLDYNHERRAAMLLGVTEYLMDELQDHPGTNENERLSSWAVDARPGDYLLVGVKGFGIAGFQYLRMLFGAQTTKPDIHIKSFVEGAVGHPVSDVQALLLMERGAGRLGLPVRDLDHQIWLERAGGDN